MTAAYLLKSKSTLAAWYKRDPGLLERHHSVRAFELLVCSRARLLRSLPSAERVALSGAVRDVIMATDMRFHGEYCDRARSLLDRRVSGEGSPDAAQQEKDMLLEMQLLLKCADLSNVFKPFSVAKEWAVRVTDEMFTQGDLERAGGLEVTHMCDRLTQSRVALQRGFIDNVVAPMMVIMAELHPGLQPQLEQLRANRRQWDEYTDETLVAEVKRIALARCQPTLMPTATSRCGIPVRRPPPPPLALSRQQLATKTLANPASGRQESAQSGRGRRASLVVQKRQSSPLARARTRRASLATCRQSSPLAVGSRPGSPLASRNTPRSPLRSMLALSHARPGVVDGTASADEGGIPIVRQSMAREQHGSASSCNISSSAPSR